jgi:hypothetical protein
VYKTESSVLWDFRFSETLNLGCVVIKALSLFCTAICAPKRPDRVHRNPPVGRGSDPPFLLGASDTVSEGPQSGCWATLFAISFVVQDKEGQGHKPNSGGRNFRICYCPSHRSGQHSGNALDQRFSNCGAPPPPGGAVGPLRRGALW